MAWVKDKHDRDESLEAAEHVARFDNHYRATYHQGNFELRAWRKQYEILKNLAYETGFLQDKKRQLVHMRMRTQMGAQFTKESKEYFLTKKDLLAMRNEVLKEVGKDPWPELDELDEYVAFVKMREKLLIEHKTDESYARINGHPGGAKGGGRDRGKGNGKGQDYGFLSH
jgi:hypothetical protein